MCQIALAPAILLEGECRRDCEKRTVRSLLALVAQTGQDYTLGYRESGAPYLVYHTDLSLSISHTEGAVAVLLSKGGSAVGIDIEQRGDKVERVLDRFLVPEELLALQREPEDRLLGHLLWSSKEAAFKRFNPKSGSLKSFRLLTPLSFALDKGYWDMSYEEESRKCFRCFFTYNDNYVLSVTGDFSESFSLNKGLFDALV